MYSYADNSSHNEYIYGSNDIGGPNSYMITQFNLKYGYGLPNGEVTRSGKLPI